MLKDVSKHLLISIMGTMGCGKTTAANLLSEKLKIPIVEENFADNLFLEHFYQDMSRWAFHSQAFFLTEKIRQLIQIKQQLKTTSIIQDTPIYQDVYSYAQAQQKMDHMSEKEWQLYQKIFEPMTRVIPKPNLVIYLETSIANVRSRITNRGREFEQDTPTEYLTILNELNNKWVKTNHKKFKILTISTDHINLVTNLADQKQFVNQVKDKINLFSKKAHL